MYMIKMAEEGNAITSHLNHVMIHPNHIYPFIKQLCKRDQVIDDVYTWLIETLSSSPNVAAKLNCVPTCENHENCLRPSWTNTHIPEDVESIANLRGICQPYESCSLVVPSDRTGMVRAHETGHLLGAGHDMDNQCNNRYDWGVMHNMAEYPETIKWSYCSAIAIYQFIETNRPKCLYDAAKRYKKHYKDAGQKIDCQGYTVNYAQSTCSACQCNGPWYPFNKRDSQLEGSSCNPHTGTLSERETGHICHKLKCVPKIKTNENVNGEWGKWGPKSKCNGEDITGYQVRERKCQSSDPKLKAHCIGISRIYIMCTPPDSRKVATYDTNSRICKQRGFKFNITSQAGDCTLICDAGDKRKVMDGINLADGTIINSDGTKKMCINGKPKFMDCKPQLLTRSAKDACGVCKGNNETCKVTIDYQNVTNLVNDFPVMIANLSANITNVEIKCGWKVIGNSPLNYIVLERNGVCIYGSGLGYVDFPHKEDFSYSQDQTGETIRSESLKYPLVIKEKLIIQNAITSVSCRVRYNKLSPTPVI